MNIAKKSKIQLICMILTMALIFSAVEFFGGTESAKAATTDKTTTDTTKQTTTTTTTKNTTTATKKTTKTTKKKVKKKKKRPTKKQLLRYLGKPSGKKLRSFNSKTNVRKLKSGKKLNAYVKKMRRSAKVSFIVIDVKTGEGLASDPNRRLWSASCLKGPYVAALCKYKPKSYKQSKNLMRPTLSVSNNDTYTALRHRYGHKPMKKLRKETNAKSFKPTWRYAYIKTRDLARLWVGTYWYFYRDTNRNSKKCRKMYTHSTQSFIRGAMKGKYKVYSKAGWYPGGGYNVQNDAGIVMAKYKGESSPYIIAVMTTAYGQHGKLRHLTKLIDKVHRDMYKQSKKRSKK